MIAPLGVAEQEPRGIEIARTREIGRSMRGAYIEYLSLFTEAKVALDAGDQPRGLGGVLRWRGFRFGGFMATREHGDDD